MLYTWVLQKTHCSTSLKTSPEPQMTSVLLAIKKQLWLTGVSFTQNSAVAAGAQEWTQCCRTSDASQPVNKLKLQQHTLWEQFHFFSLELTESLKTGAQLTFTDGTHLYYNWCKINGAAAVLCAILVFVQ